MSPQAIVSLSSLKVGAWLSAWPNSSLINTFQSDSGRHLDIINLYVDWKTQFSTVKPSLDPVYQNGSVAMITWQPDGIDTTQIPKHISYIAQFADYVLDAEGGTGTVLWNYAAGDLCQCSPAVANGIVYFDSSDKNLYAVDVATHQLKWKFATGGTLEGSPAIANGALYFGSHDFTFYAPNAATGDPLYSYTTGYEIASSPAVVNRRVYIGSADHSLYAFALP